MLTLNGSLQNENYKSKQNIQCYLMTEDGFMKTLKIPFHLILSDKSNQRVRDTILLKKIKFILRENSRESDQIWSSLTILLRDFKTPSIKQQAIERLTNTGYLSVNSILHVVSQELEQLEKNKDAQSNDSIKLYQLCQFYQKIVESYIFLEENKPVQSKAEVIEYSPVKESEKIDDDGCKASDHSEFIMVSLETSFKRLSSEF